MLNCNPLCQGCNTLQDLSSHNTLARLVKPLPKFQHCRLPTLPTEAATVNTARLSNSLPQAVNLQRVPAAGLHCKTDLAGLQNCSSFQARLPNQHNCTSCQHVSCNTLSEQGCHCQTVEVARLQNCSSTCMLKTSLPNSMPRQAYRPGKVAKLQLAQPAKSSNAGRLPASVPQPCQLATLETVQATVNGQTTTFGAPGLAACFRPFGCPKPTEIPGKLILLNSKALC